MCHRHPNREWVPNAWDFPGGHVEADESAPEALARELEEELGILIDPPSGPADEILEDAGVRLAVWFIDYGGLVENRCPEEHDEIRWVSLTEAVLLVLADPGYMSLIDRALQP